MQRTEVITTARRLGREAVKECGDVQATAVERQRQRAALAGD